MKGSNDHSIRSHLKYKHKQNQEQTPKTTYLPHQVLERINNSSSFKTERPQHQRIPEFLKEFSPNQTPSKNQRNIKSRYEIIKKEQQKLIRALERMREDEEELYTFLNQDAPELSSIDSPKDSFEQFKEIPSFSLETESPQPSPKSRDTSFKELPACKSIQVQVEPPRIQTPQQVSPSFSQTNQTFETSRSYNQLPPTPYYYPVPYYPPQQFVSFAPISYYYNPHLCTSYYNIPKQTSAFQNKRPTKRQVPANFSAKSQPPTPGPATPTQSRSQTPNVCQTQESECLLEERPGSPEIPKENESQAWSISVALSKTNNQKHEEFINRQKHLAQKRGKSTQPKSKEELLKIRKEMMKPKQPKNETKQGPKELPKEEPPKEPSKRIPRQGLLERLSNGAKEKVSREEMLRLTKKNYKQLPEVRVQQEKQKKQQEARERIRRAKEYEKERQRARKLSNNSIRNKVQN